MSYLIIIILACYLIYNALRRKINPQYGLDKQNFSIYKFSVGIIAILILHFLISLSFVVIIPENIVGVNQMLGVLDFILLIIYMELLESLLRKGKAIWFLKKIV